MLQLFFSVLSLFALGDALKLSTRRAPTYHLTNVVRKFTSDVPSHLENAMNRTMSLTFTTEDLTFDLDLELNTRIYGKHSKIFALGADGKPYERPVRYRSFQGTGSVVSTDGSVEESGVCSVNFYEDERFHCVCSTESDVYTVDLKHLQLREDKDSAHRGPMMGQDHGHGMVLVRQSEVAEEAAEPEARERRQRSQHSRHGRSLLRATSDQSQLVPFSNCFEGQYQYVHVQYIGVITDTSYNDIYGSDSNVQTAVEALFNAGDGMNMVYYYQLNIQLTLGTLYIGDAYSGSFSYRPASISSRSSINTRLDQFNTWRKEYFSAKNDNNGQWHLLTNHHAPPGTVGLAWVGTVCSYSAGTGVSNYINAATSFYGTGTWETVAHEIGHNYGAGHVWEESGLSQGRTGGIMDYGDGKYPVGSGAFQFHPTYNQDEVCEAITESFVNDNWRTQYRGLIPLENCWFQGSTDPTPEPTPQPTVAGSPTPEPTNPTPAPTPGPTPADDTGDDDDNNNGDDTGIVGSDGNTYIWKWFEGYDGYSECDLDCVGSGDTAYKTKEYSCYKQTITNQYTWGSTTYYSYSYSRVTNSYCDAGKKPTETEACSGDDVPSCNNVCGDGIVGTDEVCDTKGTNGQCCADDCSAWVVTTSACFAVTTEIDAAFKDEDGAVYLFQDQFFAKYSNYKNYGSTDWVYNEPDAGFPKLISSSFKTSFDSITAIAYATDSEIYVFSGMQYAKIDIKTGQYSGYPRTFSEDYRLPNDITNCGSITGAYKYPQDDIIRVACKNILSWASARYTITSVDSITSNGGTSGQRVTALFNTPGSTSYVMFTSDMTNRRRLNEETSDSSGSIFSNTNVTSLDQVKAQSCYDMDCAACATEDDRICYECQDNYNLYGSIMCLPNTTLMFLNFDKDSAYTIDHYFVDGGYSALQEYTYTYTGLTGDNTTAIKFDPTTRMDLAPIDLGDGKAVNSFRISFRFKPYTIDYDQLIWIDGLVAVYLKDNSELFNEFNQSAQYLVMFEVGNYTYQYSVGTGITLNEWNVVELQYTADSFRVYTNGETVKQAYSGDWADMSVDLVFNEWYLGADENGINGEMDAVSFRIVETSIPSTTNLDSESSDSSLSETDEKNFQMWMIIGIAACGLSLLLCIAVCVLGYKYHNKQTTGATQPAGYVQF